MMMTNITEKKLHIPVPANICIYKVSDKASDIWSIFENDIATKLWQIQFDHDVRHSIFFQLGHVLTEYLKQKSKKSKDYPKDRDELMNKGGIKLVFSRNDDIDKVGSKTNDGCF